MATITYKCPNCGGALKFSEEGQNWSCDYCLSSFNYDDIKALEDRLISDKQDLTFEVLESSEFRDKARTYNCTSCGAEIVTDETTAATFCYYCHSPAIIPGQLSGKYMPAKVIPFKLNKDAARDIFVKWCKRKPLLSKDFISSSQLELLSGIYVPFWLYDCEIRGQITADARRVRTWTSGDKKYTETKHYNVSRTGLASFSGIPADGSKKIEDKLMETLEPFDYSQLKDFSMSYLTGYYAEKYDMDQNEVYGRIKERVNNYTSTLLRNTIDGYSSVHVKSCNVDIYNSKATYVLLPTWMFTYKYKGKTYMFALNGQSGKIAGSLPISTSRLAAWFGGISVGVFAILIIGGMLI